MSLVGFRRRHPVAFWGCGVTVAVAGMLFLFIQWRFVHPITRTSTLAEVSRELGMDLPPSSKLIGSQHTVEIGAPNSYLSALISVNRTSLVAWMDSPPLKGKWQHPSDIWGSDHKAIDFLAMDPFIARHRDFLEGRQLEMQILEVADQARDVKSVRHTAYLLVDLDNSILLVSLSQ